MIDNHMIHDEDKILSKGDKCSCGGAWKEIDWCDDLNQPCDSTLKYCQIIGQLCEKETRLECQRCGGIVPCE